MADVFFASPTSSDVCQQTFVSLTSNHVRRQKTLNPVVRGKDTIGGGGITVGSAPVDEKKTQSGPSINVSKTFCTM
jgi:hypothetical protein